MKGGTFLPLDVPGAQEMIRRLCALQERVWRTQSDGILDAADCFCGEGGFWPLAHPGDYRNSGAAVAYIELAVEAALKAGRLPYGESSTRIGLCRFARETA